MRINVLNELRQPVGTATVFDLAEPAIRLEDIDISSLSGALTLVRTNRGLLATLKASAIASENCARCLIPTDCAVPIEFEEEFIPVLDASTARRIVRAAKAALPARLRRPVPIVWRRSKRPVLRVHPNV